ncbi:MAG: hypothetical protein ACLPLR_18890 [Terriglobales bacterium]
MTLNPQDVVVVLKSLVDASTTATKKKTDGVADEMEAEFLAAGLTYAELGEGLAMSASQVFRSAERAEEAQLVYRLTRRHGPGHIKDQTKFWPNRANLKEFLIYGVKYAFPVHRGGIVRGIPTAHAAPPLSRQIAASSEPPPVWPDPEGTVRGLEFSPLYKNVPAAARRDPKLYELLALLDAIRDGRAREREIAIRELSARIDER